jgi:hypothetical protein
LPFIFSYGDTPKNHRYLPFSPSLDKIDPKKGYTKDNVRLVITAINLALNNFGEELVAKVAQAYLETKLIVPSES